jgi:hypothetical protein
LVFESAYKVIVQISVLAWTAQEYFQKKKNAGITDFILILDLSS